MKQAIALIIALFTICAITNAQYFNNNQNAGSAPGPDAIHITQVKAVTLRDGAYTAHKRVSAVPQLSCVGGSAYGDRYKPAAVQCVNKGSDGNTIQWKCEADMDEKYQFGKLNVACEGYRYSGDEWVLKGSCGLEYELDYTSKGHRNKNNNNGYNRQTYKQNYHDTTNDDTSGSGFFFTIIVLLILAALVYKFCIAGTPNTTTAGYRPSGTTTTTTTTTNMYPDANAPPYNPEYTSNTNQNTFYRKHDYASNSGSSSSSGGGFWTGAAVGAATGFGLGRATAPSTHTYSSSSYQQPSYRSSSRYDNDDDDSSTTRTATGFATTSSR